MSPVVEPRCEFVVHGNALRVDDLIDRLFKGKAKPDDLWGGAAYRYSPGADVVGAFRWRLAGARSGNYALGTLEDAVDRHGGGVALRLLVDLFEVVDVPCGTFYVERGSTVLVRGEPGPWRPRDRRAV